MTGWIVIYFVLALGAALQNTIGFGLGLLCAPVLMIFAPEMVPEPMILNSLFITSLISYRNIKSIQLKQISFSIIGGTIGVVIASLIMFYVEYTFYRTLFGVLIICAVLISIMGYSVKINPKTSLLAGSLSGFIGTLTSAGGAPMGLLYQNSTQEGLKANLNAFFVYINVLAIITLSIAGFVEVQDFYLFVKCIPAILIGWKLSDLMNNKLASYPLKPYILSIVFLAGVSILIF
ncbi:sulfite exporter TauE/SafE family protein [Colwelliaceae bacterium BS250]